MNNIDAYAVMCVQMFTFITVYLECVEIVIWVTICLEHIDAYNIICGQVFYIADDIVIKPTT